MKKKQPFISVVIPAYNEERFIGNALLSLLDQNYPGKYEIIVVDNNSTDNTAAISKAYGAKVIHEPRKGVHFARQAGFMNAQGQYIASTDADDVVPHTWLSQLATKLDSDKDLVAVGGWFRIRKGPLYLRFLINYISTPTLVFFKYLGIRQALVGQNFMVRKSAFLAVGGFTTAAAMNEDLELAARLGKVGKVSLYYGTKWAVITSPRRWNRGFIIGSIAYFINAVSFAIFGALPIKHFSDIREEETHQLTRRKAMSITLGSILFCTLFFISPTTAVQARVEPIKKAQKEVVTKVATVTKPISEKAKNVTELKNRYEFSNTDFPDVLPYVN